MFANLLLAALAALQLTRDGAAKPAVRSARPAQTPLEASGAVRVNEVEFRTVSTPRLAASKGDRQDWFKLGFRITNRGSRPLYFELFETFEPCLRSADGKDIRSEYEREETCPMDPVLIAPGKSKTILLSAFLLSQPGNDCLLVIYDGSGGAYAFEGLAPGKHLLSFVYGHSVDNSGSTELKYEGEPPYWVGDVTTREVGVEVIMPKKQ